jgi:hypothetical protein
MGDTTIEFADRLKTLEVKINGNGGKGLEQRVSWNELLIDKLEVDKVSNEAFKEHCSEAKENVNLLEQRMKEVVIATIKSQERSWIKHAGPILTGIAAVLAVILSNI